MALTGPMAAQESRSKLPIPDPKFFINPDTVSLMVIKALPDDKGFKAMFDTAWQSLSGARGAGSNWIYRTILAKLQGDDSNAFSALLPAQFVRLDSFTEKDSEPHPTTVTTVSGWPGLQSIWYMAQGKDDEGKDFPTVELDEATLILRDGYQDPTRGRVLTKLDGTIVSFPSEARARYAVERFAKKDNTSPSPAIADLLAGLDNSHDTYGVLLNKRGSALKLLRWLNKDDVGRAETAVGKERLEEIMGKVDSMTWEGELVSDDEMKFILRFRTTSPEARLELADMLKDVREVLDGYGRAGKMETSGIDNELYVNFQMVGYRGMLQRYIERNF